MANIDVIQTAAAGARSTKTLNVLLYSDDVDTRESVRLAVGRRAARDLPEIMWLARCTQDAVDSSGSERGIDLMILDGAAAKSGGMGLCRQLKDEIYSCPPVLVLTGRVQDAWLASWSQADAVVPHPLDPIAVNAAVADLIRTQVK